MKKLNLSKFDIGYIIAFVVVTLLGIGAWYYLSGQLQQAQEADKAAQGNYSRVASDKKYNMPVTKGNVKTLTDNIELIKAQMQPVIDAKLLVKENRLRTIGKEDPVAWKHDLDDLVHRLTAEAKNRTVGLPPNFYFGFSRYTAQSPNDEQTAVLGKQLVGMDQIVSALLKVPVAKITAFRRTFEEEDKRGGGAPAGISGGEADRVPGFSTPGANNSYVAYPFEVDFTCSTENLREFIDALLQGPYVFVVRSVNVKNSAANSPLTGDLQNMAGANDQADASAAAAGPKPPQYLFGNSSLTVKMRIDMIEWTADLEQKKK